ncbi:hypothetical protein AR543_08675 [Paenibacillus bovis]|uniref:Uncharacterized protein n=1 Tax=Paenibacillus bovis TaxID=1616788 RepID=A0A172ZEI3_9BACL|nr:hypothetical protein AR543_08675 [Paenibacillus bovis]
MQARLEFNKTEDGPLRPSFSLEQMKDRSGMDVQKLVMVQNSSEELARIGIEYKRASPCSQSILDILDCKESKEV